MIFDLHTYLDNLISECRSSFVERLLYVGLQGSYLRGEATEHSDIDVMVVLDRFSVADMDIYRDILERIGYTGKACGFICGRDEMLRWSPLEVCQLRHTTKDLYGTLELYLPEATRQDEINYVKLSLGNLFHELCHRYIHAGRDRNISRFRGTCKSLFFLLQNIHYLESGVFCVTRAELMKQVSEKDRAVLELTDRFKESEFDYVFRAVFAWCQETFQRVEGIQ